MNEGDQCKRLSHEFEMAKMKSLISGLDDIDEVKALAHHLIDLLDGAKMMLATLIEEEALKKKVPIKKPPMKEAILLLVICPIPLIVLHLMLKLF